MKVLWGLACCWGYVTGPLIAWLLWYREVNLIPLSIGTFEDVHEAMVAALTRVITSLENTSDSLSSANRNPYFLLWKTMSAWDMCMRVDRTGWVKGKKIHTHAALKNMKERSIELIIEFVTGTQWELELPNDFIGFIVDELEPPLSSSSICFSFLSIIITIIIRCKCRFGNCGLHSCIIMIIAEYQCTLQMWVNPLISIIFTLGPNPSESQCSKVIEIWGRELRTVVYPYAGYGVENICPWGHSRKEIIPWIRRRTQVCHTEAARPP